MDEYPKSGFQKFRETKVSPFVGMLLALLMSLCLIMIGFTDMIGGLCIGVMSYFVLRLFRAKRIEHMISYAVILYVSSILLIFTFGEFDGDMRFLLDAFVILILPFLLIALITIWMRKNLEKARERLEKEGRLYPQGYGRCKRCGTIALPGEISCRRCGEYIDVPEEMRVKKVNCFECSECGREVPEDAGVCPYCGEVFDDDGNAENPKLNPPAERL